MKTILHRAETRGHANHGWLNSHHTFSFAGYHDPERVHFGALRVFNDDTVAAGMGFGQHPHDNMEIVSIPLSGDLHHRDSTGRDKIIREGDVQIMSAGSGIAHSEMNANKDKEVQFLQIWVFPKERNIAPRYDQKSFPEEASKNNLLTVVAPDDENAVWINQDAWFTLSAPDAGTTLDYNLHKQGNGVYLFVIEGSVVVDGETLDRRDGFGVWDADKMAIKANSNAKVLFIEVPMEFKA